MKDLFRGHPDHSGLVAVTQWAQGRLDAAVAAEGHRHAPKGTDELARLARHGVSALEVMTEVVAFAVWESRNPHACPDTKSWTFATARSVIALCPRPRRAYRPGSASSMKRNGQATYKLRIKPADLEAIGTTLRETLAPFFVTVRAAVNSREEQKAATLAAMRAPFNAPSAALVAEVGSS